MTFRLASCSCGQLRAEVLEEPIGVSVCHCYACQRRTGSVFGAPDHLRISFAIGPQRLQEAADRLVGALTGIRPPA